MHPFSVLTLGIFVAGYITARWDLVTRLYELAIFAWDHGVVVSQFIHFLLHAESYLILSIVTRCKRILSSFHLLRSPCNTHSEARLTRNRAGISNHHPLATFTN